MFYRAVQLNKTRKMVGKGNSVWANNNGHFVTGTTKKNKKIFLWKWTDRRIDTKNNCLRNEKEDKMFGSHYKALANKKKLN